MPGGSDVSERNPDSYKTVLTGHKFVDDDPNEVYHYHIYNDTIITMADEVASDANFPVDENTLLDGFTIADAVEYGVYGVGVDFTLKNCKVADSGEYGIYAEDAEITIENCTVTDSGLYDGIHVEDGDLTITWSKIENNEEHGIYHKGQGNTIIVENSHIVNNKWHGAFCQYSTPRIINSVVLGNGYDGSFDGINITLPTTVPLLYNNTIVYNTKAGIYWLDDQKINDPNDKDYPDIQNSILWYNNNGGKQAAGFDPNIRASYSAVQGCDDTKNNNIDEAPGFVLAFDADDPCSVVNPYHYHLAYDSVCKDKGNPDHDANDLGLYDIDGEDRLDNSRADIGADELYSCDDDLSADDIYNPLDWSFDGIVNNAEFARFASMWLMRDPNDPGIITDPNFSSDPDYADPETLAMWFEKWDAFYNLDNDGNSQYMIDVDDLMVVAADWLWIACWKESQMDIFEDMATSMAMGGGEGMAMMMPMAFGFGFESFTEPVPEQEPELSTGEVFSLAEGIYSIIEYVDITIEEGYENTDDLCEMKDFLEDVLQDLQEGL
jgi:hypothetical protein